MAIVSINIPQLGEGLQEARLVEFLKKPGDRVDRDECIYVMETDKAISEIEATDAGTVVEWLIEPGAVVEIGAEIGKLDIGNAASIETPDATAVSLAEGGVAATESIGVVAAVPKKINALIPPRTRKYLKEKGLLDVAEQIPAAGSKLMPADVDRYLEGPSVAAASLASAPIEDCPFEDRKVAADQQTLIYRMARGTQVVLPAVLETEIDWTRIKAARDQVRDSGGPTGFAMFLSCVVAAIKKHPMLRSSMTTDSKSIRTYQRVNLGIAVSLVGDDLKTAVVRNADTMGQAAFFDALNDRIEQARSGVDQIDSTTTVTVSNIGIVGMRSGIPLVVTPAVATMALGEIRDKPVPSADGFTFQKVATLTMSFDHRLLNGVGAANFLNDLRELAASFELR